MRTHFAPPERLSREEVEALSQGLRSSLPLSWFDAVPLSVVVVNSCRQILYCNEAFRSLAHRRGSEDFIGLRPGEALNCVHSALEEAGCGCSEFCSVCGAAQAILQSLRGVDDCQLCRMLRLLDGTESALDLEVHARTMEHEGQRLVFFTALDISHEKRLRYQDRAFHHVLVELAGGMETLTRLLDMQALDGVSAELFADCTRRLLREVVYHRDVTLAEQGLLTVARDAVAVQGLLERAARECCEAAGAVRPRVLVDCRYGNIWSDQRLLGHVLRNMLANAVEACTASTDEVLASCRAEVRGVAISVRNPGVIPPDIRKQVFKRYVSTKGADRGLGTYVMRLLAERYLDAAITFQTGEEGTTFTLHLKE
ncbi:MAG: GHKL domain-containing protein [Proteobacteria bacterium]|nr:GHKL domain-containing protein [Pseudomonadota bacterium]MBU1596727.1 GHKL domain-containing protein [Pseudomonadota bacterium]